MSTLSSNGKILYASIDERLNNASFKSLHEFVRGINNKMHGFSDNVVDEVVSVVGQFRRVQKAIDKYYSDDLNSDAWARIHILITQNPTMNDEQIAQQCKFKTRAGKPVTARHVKAVRPVD
jgi:hypothetical protein